MKNTLKYLSAVAAGLVIPVVCGAAEAQENWVKNCQKCHAADGSGSTPVGKKLKVKNYTDPAVQAEMTDEEMFKITKEGAKDAAGKTTMPGYAEKLTDDEIHALVAYVRSLKKE